MKYKVLLFLKHNNKKILFYINQLVYKNNNSVTFLPKSSAIRLFGGRGIPHGYRKKIKIIYCGQNNYVEIHEPRNIKSLNILFLGNNNRVIIKKGINIIKNMDIYCGDSSFVSIGKMFSVNEILISTQRTSGYKITIGNDCLFSRGLVIRNGDGHTIFDEKTKGILNQPENVEIGNHVWIAESVKILKGSKIPDNCVVGAGAIVTKKFSEPNCILAGIPAKVIKTGINWHRFGTEKFEKYKDSLYFND